MKIVGYADRWSIQPGETLQVMVSAESPRYHARLVRLIHGKVAVSSHVTRSAKRGSGTGISISGLRV